jgi:hypothetical protein
MDVIVTPCTGVEVHTQTVMACRVPTDPTGRQADGLIEVQARGPLPVDWLAWSDGLAQAGMTQVARERTGA